MSSQENEAEVAEGGELATGGSSVGSSDDELHQRQQQRSNEDVSTEHLEHVQETLNPNDNDVVFGCEDYVFGNTRWKDMIACQKEQYKLLSGKGKHLLCRNIVSIIQNQNGRFLKYSSDQDIWVELTYTMAVQKTFQAFASMT